MKVVVIGGGISGLATAFHIEKIAKEKKLHLELTLLERRTKPGGRISTLHEKGYHIEEGANGFLNSKPSTLKLSSQLGLKEKLIYADPSAKLRFVFLDGKLIPLPMGPISFLRSPLLSVRGKLRLLGERFVSKRDDTSEESVFEFGSRRIGEEATYKLLDALVTGIHAGDFKLLSVNAAFPRIVEFEKNYGSLFKALSKVAKDRKERAKKEGNKQKNAVGAPTGTLTSFPLGMSTLIDELSRQIEGKILCGVQVRAIEDTSNKTWRIYDTKQNAYEADAVVLASPSYQQASMVKSINPALATLLSSIPYNKVAMVALGYRKKDLQQLPKGFGYIAPQHTHRMVLGILWTSSFYGDRAPQDEFLVRAICGGWNHPEIADMDEEKLLETLRNEIQLTMKITAQPVFRHIKQWNHGIPQYHVGHLSKLSLIEKEVEKHHGLFLTGNSFQGIAMNDCTAQASIYGKKVVEYLSPQP